MAKPYPQITLEERSGEAFTDLGKAQQSARRMLAASLAQTIKRMIESGDLEIIENQIKPKGK